MSLRITLPLSRKATATTSILSVPDDGLIDTFGRRHNNLRISVTDRCNLRCTYCMPEDVTFRDKSELLSFEEIARFVSVVAPMGIDKIRLTGGEPLMRRDLHKLVRLLATIPGITDLGLTTNGLLLARQARELHEAGLHRLNVSLDTLDPVRFRELSRRDGVEQVIEGLNVARDVGFQRIKVNAVAIRGFIEHDAIPLAHFCREHGFDIRFIEYMPIGAEPWERAKMFSAAELIELLQQEFGSLTVAPDHDPRAPAVDYLSREGQRFGFIASVSRPFCGSCNRLRLTAEGQLRNCLFALDEIDLRPLLRDSFDETCLREAVRQSVYQKWEGHEINTARFLKPDRTMHAIGG